METNTTVPVSQILDRYERECLPLLSPNTQQDYRRHLKVLHREFGSLDANTLEPRMFGPFLSVKKGYHNRAKMLAMLSSAFTHAVSHWYLIRSNAASGNV